MSGLGLGFDFSAALGSVERELKAGNAVGRTQLQIGWRKYQPITGSITGVGSQTAGTVIAGPEAGRLWHIHRLSFAPAQIGQAVATPGTIIIGKGTGIQTATQGSGQIVTGNSQSGQFVEIDRTTTVPGKLTYGRGQFVLVSPLNLIVLWASGTNVVPLVIDGDAYEYLSETAQPAPG